jgi:hypothetical protein
MIPAQPFSRARNFGKGNTTLSISQHLPVASLASQASNATRLLLKDIVAEKPDGLEEVPPLQVLVDL